MREKRRPPAFPSWPERQLLWVARERSIALWMHGAATRAWIVNVLKTVSRIGDGWLWYAIVVGLPWAGGAEGTSAAVRMFAVGLVDILIYRIVKRWIARPRPCRACPGIRECA